MSAAEDPMIIVSPTFYPSLDDKRCELGLEACKRAVAAGLRMLLVDASPPEVHAALAATGVLVRKQTAKGRKGAALREAISAAVALLPADGIICYQELEKVEMVSLQRGVADAIRASGAGVCVPRRQDKAFRESYPVDQYHSEHFANGYLDSLARPVGFPSVDWTFGPLALRASLAPHWLACNGELWDAQIVPMVEAARWAGKGVIEHPVHYTHPPEMKAEEEGVPKWSEKRLEQLNFLFLHVGGALKATSAPHLRAGP